MKDRLFFDANIIYYAFDSSAPKKRSACENLIKEVMSGGIIGVVSNQVLGELFSAAVKKLSVPPAAAKLLAHTIIASEKWQKINYTQDTVGRAIEEFGDLRVPFWDLLIAETMKENGIATIVTENVKDFERIPWIAVKNPFA